MMDDWDVCHSTNLIAWRLWDEANEDGDGMSAAERT